MNDILTLITDYFGDTSLVSRDTNESQELLTMTCRSLPRVMSKSLSRW